MTTDHQELKFSGGGYSSIKVTGCSSENFENTPKRYQNFVLWACPKFISTPKRYQFISLALQILIVLKITFSSQGRFVINRYPNKGGSSHFRFKNPKRYQFKPNLNQI